MADWFVETGVIYLLGVALIPVVGLLLVLWGLWGDRGKGRARCPKCWYDMRGTVPRLECPECGHDVRQRHRLYRNRRGRRRVVIGVVLVLLSAYPLAVIGGWWREQAVMCRYGIPYYYPNHPQRIGPTWLVDRLPEELAHFFDRVEDLTVDDPARFAACGRLRYLRWLQVQVNQITDADLAHLGRSSNLVDLRLSSTDVTDADLVHLKALSNLWILDLSDTQVTDAGLVHLKALPNLAYLYLARTQITDAGPVHLKTLSKLESLDLTGTQVTEAGVAELKQALPSIKVTHQ